MDPAKKNLVDEVKHLMTEKEVVSPDSSGIVLVTPYHRQRIILAEVRTLDDVDGLPDTYLSVLRDYLKNG